MPRHAAETRGASCQVMSKGEGGGGFGSGARRGARHAARTQRLTGRERERRAAEACGARRGGIGAGRATGLPSAVHLRTAAPIFPRPSVTSAIPVVWA